MNTYNIGCKIVRDIYRVKAIVGYWSQRPQAQRPQYTTAPLHKGHKPQRPQSIMATVHNGQKKWSQRPNKMVTTVTLHWSQRPQIGHNGHIVLVTTATQHWSQGPHSIGQHWSQGPHIIVQYWSQGPHSIGHKGHNALVTRATRNWSQVPHIILCITTDSRDSNLCMYYVSILLSLSAYNLPFLPRLSLYIHCYLNEYV